MKTTLFALFGIFLILTTVTVDAQSFTLTNTFGGDGDDIADNDFLTFEKGADDKFDAGDVLVSDRLQFDFNSDKLDGRMRLQFQTGQQSGKDTNGNTNEIRFRGFMRFRPVSVFGIAAGNDFFTKYAVAGSYLAAADDNPKDGRMAENGFAAIADIGALRVVGNIGGTAFTKSEEVKLNAGVDYAIGEIATVGAVFKNISNDNFSAAVFAGLTSIENLILNAGFLYNAVDTDFITDSAKLAVSVSAAYELTDLNLGLYADFMTGLTSEYMKDGETFDHAEDAIPMQFRGRVAYNVTEAFALNLDGIFKMMVGNDDEFGMVIYPYATYKITDFGNLKAGLRMNFEKDDMTSFSIPLAWEYKIASK